MVKQFIYIYRYSALKENWNKIYEPIAKQLKLQIMYDINRSTVSVRTCDQTKDIGALQKAAEFIRAFSLGKFEQISLHQLIIVFLLM